VAGLGHDEPTLLITNRELLPAKQVTETYSRRMNIEQRLAEAIRSFKLDALAGAVPLNVDLDVVLSVLAHTVCVALRRRLPGYATAHQTEPCNADSSPPADTSCTAATTSSSALTDAPTHLSYAKPTYPQPSPSPVATVATGAATARDGACVAC
jgi:hypothetical protein